MRFLSPPRPCSATFEGVAFLDMSRLRENRLLCFRLALDRMELQAILVLNNHRFESEDPPKAQVVLGPPLTSQRSSSTCGPAQGVEHYYLVCTQIANDLCLVLNRQKHVLQSFPRMSHAVASLVLSTILSLSPDALTTCFKKRETIE